MVVRQAVVCIGGQGSRLAALRPEFRGAKSFISFGGHTALHYTLTSMRAAGVHRVILVGDTSAVLEKGRDEAVNVGFPFRDITCFHDAGLGVHGIPIQVEMLLEEKYIFDAGHSMTTPGHYLLLGHLVTNGVGYTAAASGINNTSRAYCDHAVDWLGPHWGDYSVGLPYILDKRWCRDISAVKYRINKLVHDGIYSGKAGVRTTQFVLTSRRLEFDISAEYEECRKEFLRIALAQRALS